MVELERVDGGPGQGTDSRAWFVFCVKEEMDTLEVPPVFEGVAFCEVVVLSP